MDGADTGLHVGEQPVLVVPLSFARWPMSAVASEAARRLGLRQGPPDESRGLLRGAFSAHCWARRPMLVI